MLKSVNYSFEYLDSYTLQNAISCYSFNAQTVLVSTKLPYAAKYEYDQFSKLETIELP